jgi:glycosyltransferase involved in cell wall biosynthesis
MKIKNIICFVIGSFQRGGAEQHVVDLAKTLRGEGYDVHIVVSNMTGPLLKDVLLEGISIVEYRQSRYNPIRQLLVILKFARYIRNNKITVLHVHLIGSFLFGVTAGVLSRVEKIFITWHGLYDKSRIVNTLPVKYAAKLSTKIISVSNKVHRFNCNEYGVPFEKSIVIHNGIDLKSPRKINNTYSSDGILRICAVGNLRPEKGYEYLIEAVECLLSESYNIELEIFGDGSNRSMLNKIINSTEYETMIHLAGNNSNIRTILPIYDLWIMSSIFEGFSIALLEAMNAGVPIIATNTGGNSEAIIDGWSGVIVPIKSSSAIANAIVDFMEDSDKYFKYSRNALMTVSTKYDVREMKDKYISLYDE